MSQQINLLNPALLTPKEWLDARMMVIYTLGVLGLVMLVYAGLSYDVSRLEQQQQQLADELAGLSSELEQELAQQQVPKLDESVLQQIRLAEKRLVDSKRVLDFLRDKTFARGEGMSGYLEALARQRTEGVWLTGVEIDQPRELLEIKASALREQRIPVFIQNLSQQPVMAGKYFAQLTMDRNVEQEGAFSRLDFRLKSVEKDDTVAGEH